METLKLQVNKKIYEELLHLLKQFKAEDLRIIEDGTTENSFQQQKKLLQGKLDQIDGQKARFISLEEMDRQLEKTINTHKNQNS